MKIKLVAAACAALCSLSAFAAPLNPATQAPELTFYIAGASAQGGAVKVVVPADLFATPAEVVTIIDPANAKNAQAYYGMSKASLTTTSKRMLVVYNSNNGSHSGVAQLMSTGVTEADATVVTVGTSACTVAAGVNTYSCTSRAPLEADMALSDVYPSEAPTGVLPTTDAISIGALTIAKTALQGFGIIVNPALYGALQTQNIANGQLPASCAGSAALACQPSMRRADYASLATGDGSIKDAAGLLGDPADGTALTLVRRVESSGTQAASNLFFANNVCGTLGYLGALGPIGAIDASPGVLDIVEAAGSGDVKTAVNTLGGYVLGVVSLENIPAGTDTYKFVKIDNVSPNVVTTSAGVTSLDPKNRKAFASGSYPFAFEMTGMYRTSANLQTKNLARAVIDGLKNSTKHDLAGIGYLDGSSFAGGKGSRVSRGGNNCQPLLP